MQIHGFSVLRRQMNKLGEKKGCYLEIVVIYGAGDIGIANASQKSPCLHGREPSTTFIRNNELPLTKAAHLWEPSSTKSRVSETDHDLGTWYLSPWFSLQIFICAFNLSVKLTTNIEFKFEI